MLHLRHVLAGDLPAIQDLNEQGLPYVNHLELAQIRWFAEVAAYFRVAESNGRLAGFLIAVTPETDYPSPYFAWFCQRYTQFIYIDRIVVAGWARRRGVARALYRDVERFACEQAYLLTVDVYSQPPNDISLTFHRNYGFEEIGSQEVEQGTKTVVKFMKRPRRVKCLTSGSP